MDSVLEQHKKAVANPQKFPLFISQDGEDESVQDLAAGYEPLVKYLQHVEREKPVMKHRKENPAYYRIAAHYKFILTQFFDCFGYPRLVLLEDDMELAPDFFLYFEATSELLDGDPTLMCVSSWNDHGQSHLVRDAMRLYRSDFFPGLGWMLTAKLWADLKPDWPAAYWDDWMRQRDVRQGRQCIRPEVCRTYNFGEEGASRGQFFKDFLAPVRLNDMEVPWATLDLGYLEPAKYAEDLERLLSRAPVLSIQDAKQAEGDVQVRYSSQGEYERIAGELRMLREWKDGVPRGAYNGTVNVCYKDAHIWIVPGPDFRAAAPEPQGAFVDASGAVLRRRQRRPALRRLGRGRQAEI